MFFFWDKVRCADETGFFRQMCCGSIFWTEFANSRHMSCGKSRGLRTFFSADTCLVDTSHPTQVTDVLWTNRHMYGGSWFRSLYGQMSCGHAPIHLLGHMSCGKGGTSQTHVRWHLKSGFKSLSQLLEAVVKTRDPYTSSLRYMSNHHYLWAC